MGFVLVLATLISAQDEIAELKFLVVKDYNGKPIRNASVVLHPVERNGKQSRGGLQIKTDLQTEPVTVKVDGTVSVP